MKLHPYIGFSNLWEGEYQLNRSITLFGVMAQFKPGSWNVWVHVINVGLYISVETGTYRARRRERMRRLVQAAVALRSSGVEVSDE